VLPLSDGLPARRFSLVHTSFYPCTVTNACHGLEPTRVDDRIDVDY